MDKKNGKKTGKKTQKTDKAISKGRATIVEHNEEYTDLHASLSDSIFKDSFDKFLGDRGDRRKQLNLKENVRASFNRDSSFELSTISEPDSTASTINLPFKARNTVCSTPNVKFSNFVGTLTTPRNDSSDLFASYAGFELNGSQESVTKSQLNSQGDSNPFSSLSKTPAKNLFDEFISHDRGARRRMKKTLLTRADAQSTLPDNKLNASHGEACDVMPAEHENLFQSIDMSTNGLVPITRSRFSIQDKSNEVVEIAEMSTQNDDGGGGGDKSDYNPSTSNVQLCSANSSVDEETDFFRCLRKRASQDLSSELVNSLNVSNRMSSSNDTSVDSVEAKSSIGQNFTDNDRHDSCIEISSELSSLLTDSQIPGELSKLSEPHSISSLNIKIEDPSCNISSVVTRTVTEVGDCEVRRRLRRTLLEIMKRVIDSTESRRLTTLKKSISASPANNLNSDLNAISTQSSDNATHDENGAVSSHSLDPHTSIGDDTLNPRCNLENTSIDHSIAAPIFNDECDSTAADSHDDVFCGIDDEQHESIDDQMVMEVENNESIRRTIGEVIQLITDSRRTNASADSVDDVFCGLDDDQHQSTDAQTVTEVENNKIIRRTIFEVMKRITNSFKGRRTTAPETFICESMANNLSSNSVSGESSDNSTKETHDSIHSLQTESSNDTLNPHSNLGHSDIDHSIALQHSNDKCDITAANSVLRCIDRPDKSNMNETPSKERADINVSKRRRYNFKRLVTPVKSSDNIVSSQYVVTRKKPKLFDTSEPNVHDVSNTTVITDTNTSFSRFGPDGSRSAHGIKNEIAFSVEASESATNPNEVNLTPAKLEMISAVEECNETKMTTESVIPSSLVRLSTGVSDPRLDPREHLRDISHTINCVNVTKRKRKMFVNTLHLPAINESSENDQIDNGITAELLTSLSETNCQTTNMDNDLHSVTLHPGKWRRSLSLYRRHSNSIRSAFLLEQTDVESINSLKISLSNESNRQRLRHSVSFNLSRDNYADLNETSDRRAARRRRTSVVNPIVDAGRLTEFDFRSTYEARDTILRKCGQSEPLEFADVYSQGALRHCRKIGEGVYGEVFMNKTDAGRAIVLKIIPIEGILEVNGEPQKKFDEVLSEIVIALQLSSLRNDKEYMTSSFAEVVQVRCVQGRYPNHLIDLWELYRDNYQTENDHPEIFGDDQLYIVFELANGGQDLEAFQFSNALQTKSTFQQMALALAIAEKKLQFEHRDLHWGNILLSPTDEKFVNFKFNGNTLQIPSEGIKVTIIDYTLSRMLYDGIVLYNDLSNDDELFTAHGDYQFDIYRLMKSNLENDWQRFVPLNNILWLHYIVDKLINGARYKNTKSRKHRLAIEDLMVIRDEITNYKSAVESVSLI